MNSIVYIHQYIININIKYIYINNKIVLFFIGFFLVFKITLVFWFIIIKLM